MFVDVVIMITSMLALALSALALVHGGGTK